MYGRGGNICLPKRQAPPWRQKGPPVTDEVCDRGPTNSIGKVQMISGPLGAAAFHEEDVEISTQVQTGKPRLRKLASLLCRAVELNSNPIPVPHIENEIQSLVLRLWFEPTSKSGDEGEWRGHITDVTSLERRYFRNPNDLMVFLSERMKTVATGSESEDREENRESELSLETASDQSATT